MAAHATEPDLHLIGNADPAGPTHVVVCGLEVPCGRNHLSTARQQRFADKAGSRALQRPEHRAYLVAIGDTGAPALPLVPPSIAVGHRDDVHPILALTRPPLTQNL